MSYIKKIKCFLKFHDFKLQTFDEERVIFDLGKEVFRYRRLVNIYFCKNCKKEQKACQKKQDGIA